MFILKHIKMYSRQHIVKLNSGLISVDTSLLFEEIDCDIKTGELSYKRSLQFQSKKKSRNLLILQHGISTVNVSTLTFSSTSLL